MTLNKKIQLFTFFILTISGCSSEDPTSLEEQPLPSENVYLEQNKWIYTQMNHDYLWREDMPDSLGCNYDQNPKDFFQSLLSKKDRFSYLTTNDSYSQEIYGIHFAYQKYRDSHGTEALQILYSKSEVAKKSGIKRGDFIQVVHSDSNYTYYKKIFLDNGCFKKNEDTSEIKLSLSNNNDSSNILCDSVYNIEGKQIGYLCYLRFEDTPELFNVLFKLKRENIEELILDLRYNPGGYVNTCKYLCNCLVPKSAYNSIFQQCSYNDILSNYYLYKTGNERTFTLFNEPYPEGIDTLEPNVVPIDIKRIFVLTSSYTASASEATIICLRPYINVLVIGEKTVGKGVGSWNIRDRRFKYSIQPITMRYYNANDETTPDEGITPDYYVAEGFETSKKEIGDINEPLLNTAINVILGKQNIDTSVKKIAAYDNVLTPIGEPSFVTEFRNKQFDSLK